MTYRGPDPTSRKPYFEGWYFKLVTKSGRALALIPGVQHTRVGATSFIQLIDGFSGITDYFEFSRDSFEAQKNPFTIRIEKNTFSLEGFDVDLKNQKRIISGQVSFYNRIPYQPIVGTSSIMGPFDYLPMMECRHGVLSIDHDLSGSLILDNGQINFDGGRGYIEKDWGRSFPSSYIWLQTNHFNQKGNSFLLSLARIPYLGMAFPGFLGYLHFDNRWFRFGTYTGAKVFGSCRVDELTLSVQRGPKRLEINARRSRSGLLQAPVNGEMKRPIHESLDASIELRLYRGSKLEWSGLGKSAGMEIVGNPKDLGLS